MVGRSLHQEVLEREQQCKSVIKWSLMETVLNTRTFKKDCPCHLSFKVDKFGSSLEVTSICTEHNHDVSKVNSVILHGQSIQLFVGFICAFSMSETPVKDKATQLLSLKANKKLVQQKLSQETGQVVLLKDLTNVSTMMRKEKSRNYIDKVVQTLMERYGKINNTNNCVI